ncbi:MAG: DUF1735 domain-containing protein [Porphyromonas sp.]|nr:DUF1735 domain-containing protein [Porphyromonas sp.]
MRNIKLLTATLLSALFFGACADKDPRIGELLNEDLSTDPNISIVYIKNNEIPYSAIEEHVVYLMADEVYKDNESGTIEVSFPVQITKPLTSDLTVEVVEDTDRIKQLDGSAEVLDPETQITSKSSKVTIKAGELKSADNAVFTIELKKLGEGTRFVYPVTLKVEEERKDCIIAQNFRSLDLKVNVLYSMEGMLTTGTELNPAFQEIEEAADFRYGYYELPAPDLFDNDLKTSVDSYAYYDLIGLSGLEERVHGFSIQPRWNPSQESFDEIAKSLEVWIIDENDQDQKLGVVDLPDFSGLTEEDNPIVYFEFKKPIKIHGLYLYDADRYNDAWRIIYISEFRLYR